MSADLSNEETKRSTAESSTTDEATPQKNTSEPFSNWEIFKSSKIDVKVGHPVLRDELFSKYFVYKIQGADLKGYFETQRRYSDFEKVRNMLVARWPGCFVPSLPPKVLKNTQQGVVDDRAKFLHNFCKQIAETPHLHYSDVYQVFLRTRMVDLDPILHQYQKVRYEDIIRRYSAVFGHLAGKDLGSDTEVKIANFNAYLTKVQGLFENFRKLGKQAVIARREYNSNLVKFHGIMSNEYEKYVLAEYHDQKPGKSVFRDEETSDMNVAMGKFDEIQKEDSIEVLYEWIKAEGRDILAFKEAFTQREKYEGLRSKTEKKQRADTNSMHNAAAGKKSIGSLFSNESRDSAIARLEDKISHSTKDIEYLGTVQDMITMVLVHEEIDKFKASRIGKYHDVVSRSAHCELRCLTAVSEYWDAMLENPNLKSIENA